MTIGDRRDNALAAPGPAVATGHVGRGGRFVDEHQLGRVETALHRSPGGARRGYVGAILLGRPDLLFFSVTPSRLSARHTVTSPAATPPAQSGPGDAPRFSPAGARCCAAPAVPRCGAGAGRPSPHRTG